MNKLSKECDMKETKPVELNGKPLKCLMCESEDFKEVSVKLNKKWLTILDIEMFAKSGKAYICKQCGFLMEFYK